MKHFLIVIVLAIMAGLSDLAIGQEMEAAEGSILECEKRIEREKKELDEAVRKAQLIYQARVIKAKERCLAELTRHYKLAVKNDKPNTAEVIKTKIDALELEITQLKDSDVADKAEGGENDETVKTKFTPFVGLWQIGPPSEPNGRIIAIFETGEVFVVKFPDKAGMDLGAIYQGHVDGNTFYCDWMKWNEQPFTSGRAGAITLHENGAVTIHNGRAGQWQLHQKMDSAWKAARKEIHNKIPLRVMKKFEEIKKELHKLPDRNEE